jgi:hypothetical protein
VSFSPAIPTLLLAACTVLTGCDLGLRPGAATIQEALIPVNSTPGEQAAMAINIYDANDRYLGTLGLANQDFAGEPLYINLFETNIKDEDPMVRAASIRGLANHGEPRHVAQIASFLADANPMVRLEAARGLQRLHGPAAVDPLIIAAREPDPRRPDIPSETEPEIRTEAAAALGQYAEDRVLRALSAALDDSDLAVNRAALRSLKILTGQDLGLDSVAWESWKAKADNPFAGRGLYTFPAYSRKQRIYEYIPLVPRPPNEVAAPPTGLPR